MKYAPYVAIAIATGLVVGLGLYLTKDSNCLWGLIVLWPTGYFARDAAVGEG